MKTVFDGPGIYVWQVKRCTNGYGANTEEARQFLLNTLKQNNLAWAAIKICDGVNRYNMRKDSNNVWQDDILPELFKLMAEAGLPRIGWQYMYGGNPKQEAQVAANRIIQFDLDGFIMDPEAEYKQYSDAHAGVYMEELQRLVDVPIALSSYRWPTLHNDFPWEGFLGHMSKAHGDVHMPQVYWVGDFRPEGPAEQLDRSIRELTDIIDLPFVPAGAAYGEPLKDGTYWAPTPAQMANFSEHAHALCNGMTWWCLDEMFEKDTHDERGWFDEINYQSGLWGFETEEPEEPEENNMWKDNARGVYWREAVNFGEDMGSPEGYDYVVAEASSFFTSDVQAAYDAKKPILLLFANDPELYRDMNLGAWPEPDDDPQIKAFDRMLKMASGKMRQVHGIILDCSKVKMANGDNLTDTWIAEHGKHMLQIIWERYHLPVWMYMNGDPLRTWPDSPSITTWIDGIGVSTVCLVEETDGYPKEGTKPVLPYWGKLGWGFWLYSVDSDWKFLYNGSKEELYSMLGYKAQEEEPEEEKPEEGEPEPETPTPTGMNKYEVYLSDTILPHDTIEGTTCIFFPQYGAVEITDGSKLVYAASHINYVKKV